MQFNFYGLALLIGAVMLIASLVGYVFADNPFISEFPYVGENVKWIGNNITLLLPLSAFLVTSGMFMDFRIGLLGALLTYIIFMPALGLPGPLDAIGGMFA